MAHERRTKKDLWRRRGRDDDGRRMDDDDEGEDGAMVGLFVVDVYHVL